VADVSVLPEPLERWYQAERQVRAVSARVGSFLEHQALAPEPYVRALQHVLVEARRLSVLEEAAIVGAIASALGLDGGVIACPPE
jgi:hypothetical protein